MPIRVTKLLSHGFDERAERSFGWPDCRRGQADVVEFADDIGVLDGVPPIRAGSQSPNPDQWERWGQITIEGRDRPAPRHSWHDLRQVQAL